MKKLFEKYEVDEEGNVYNLDGKPRKLLTSGNYRLNRKGKPITLTKAKSYAIGYLGADYNDVIIHDSCTFFNELSMTIIKNKDFKIIPEYPKYMITKKGVVAHAINYNPSLISIKNGKKKVLLRGEVNNMDSVFVSTLLINTFNNKSYTSTKDLSNIVFIDGNYTNCTYANLKEIKTETKPLIGTSYCFNPDTQTIYNNKMIEVHSRNSKYTLIIDGCQRVVNLQNILESVDLSIDIVEVIERNKKGCLASLDIDFNEAMICSRVFNSTMYDRSIKSWSNDCVKLFYNHLTKIKSFISKEPKDLTTKECRTIRKKILSLK